MNPPPEEARSDLHLEDQLWLRRLARSLLADAARAEDAAQETWLVAMTGQRGGRAWLAGVLRNLLRQSARADARRAVRERVGREDLRAPEAAEVVERIELQDHVMTAVKALDEPYRTAIVMRYMDGRATRHIAARLGIPVATVNTRLDRARGKLRVVLDAADPPPVPRSAHSRDAARCARLRAVWLVRRGAAQCIERAFLRRAAARAYVRGGHEALV